MNFELDQLLVFCRVAKLGSFTRAAEELFLSQPAVSASIAKLEHRLQARLVDRIGRRIYLTEAGRQLYVHAEKIEQLCSLIEQVERSIVEPDGDLRGRLAVGANDTLGVNMLPPLLGEFKQKHPRVEIALAIGSSKRLLEGLAKHDFDFCLVGITPKVPLVEYEFLMDDNLSLYVGRGHRWAARGSDGIALQELASEPFISHRPGAGTARSILEEFEKHGFDLTPNLVIENLEAIKRLVESGLGVSIVSDMAARREVDRGTLVAVPIQGAGFIRRFWIATLRGMHLSAAVRSLLSFIGQEVAKERSSPASLPTELNRVSVEA